MGVEVDMRGERELGRFQLFLLNIGICGANDFENRLMILQVTSLISRFVSFMEIRQATNAVTQS